jgi:hypothetical protein
MWPSGRAGQAFVLRESGVADATTADSLVVDRHAPQQDGQTGKSKLLARSCLRILVQRHERPGCPTANDQKSNDLWAALVDEPMAQLHGCAMPILKLLGLA